MSLHHRNQQVNCHYLCILPAQEVQNTFIFFYQNDGPPNRMICEASLDQDEIIKTWKILAFIFLQTTGLHSIIT